MNNTYSAIIPTDQDSGFSGESFRIFDSSYNTYPSYYSDYSTASKLEAFDSNYWPATHNILPHPTVAVLDQIHTALPANETSKSANFVQINSSTAISATHHHHHIHQHLFPQIPPSPTGNDSSTWLGSGDYQSLHSATNPSSCRQYSTPCSFYPTNSFYDPTQAQWTPPLPLKFEPSYTPPPSYFESSETLNHCSEQLSRDESSENFEQMNSLASQLSSIPPKNPLNGKTRTRDKYRIVYTDQQRYELENEFVMSKYISIPRKSALSLTLALSERQIKIWFQNRRAKERKLSKKRQETSSIHQLNHSNDGDSPSDGDLESPNYYPIYT